MALTGDTIDFVQGGVVTSSAQIVDAGATVGDVLTVQADKSIAAAPGGGSQTVATVVDEVLFSDFTLAPGEAPSWPGRAPYRTIAAGQVVLDCRILVTEAFNDSGSPSEIQVTDHPDGDGTQLCWDTPNPAALITNGATIRGGDVSTTAIQVSFFKSASGPLTPIVGLNAFVDDGTTGRALIFTTIYTPA